MDNIDLNTHKKYYSYCNIRALFRAYNDKTPDIKTIIIKKLGI